MIHRSASSYETAKRVLDVAIALMVLVLLGPLWLLIALMIRITSPGPALFRLHREVGKDGREFTMFKFRTMYHNSDVSIHKRAFEQFAAGKPVAAVNKKGVAVPVYKIVSDPRITPFGRLLRKSGLDEIPQLLNVLKGEMSLVGPRPAQYYEYPLYNEQQRQRFSVLPGITGLYQVSARSEVPFEEMVRLDLEYVKNRSLWMDTKILLKTPWILLHAKGAH